jgi:hypothetical protein
MRPAGNRGLLLRLNLSVNVRPALARVVEQFSPPRRRQGFLTLHVETSPPPAGVRDQPLQARPLGRHQPATLLVPAVARLHGGTCLPTD